MKLVVAVIKPFKLEDVKSARETFGIKGITVNEVQGYGRQLSALRPDAARKASCRCLPWPSCRR